MIYHYTFIRGTRYTLSVSAILQTNSSTERTNRIAGNNRNNGKEPSHDCYCKSGTAVFLPFVRSVTRMTALFRTRLEQHGNETNG